MTFLHSDVVPHSHDSLLSAPLLVGAAVLTTISVAAVVFLIRRKS